MPAAGDHASLCVIEPKLRGPSGHYAEFVRAVASRAGGIFPSIEVVADPRARDYLRTLGGEVPVVATGAAKGPAAEIAAIGASMRAGKRTLVLTATAMHVFAADWLSFAGRAQLEALTLLVHWPLSRQPGRTALAMGARTRRNALFLATTRGVRDMLLDAGCARATQISYPATRTAGAPMRAPFRHLLMGGAARFNKGLDLVAELAERFAREGRVAPLLVQVSPKHVDHHGTREGAVVERLLSAGYRGLVADPRAPDRAEYVSRFTGALVLAPYERSKFEDRVSGVVLDALLHGAPCIATSGTWSGDIVERFGAGVTIGERTGAELTAAVDRVLGRWDHFAARAAEASDILADEHDPRHVALLLAEGGGRAATSGG